MNGLLGVKFRHIYSNTAEILNSRCIKVSDASNGMVWFNDQRKTVYITFGSSLHSCWIERQTKAM